MRKSHQIIQVFSYFWLISSSANAQQAASQSNEGLQAISSPIAEVNVVGRSATEAAKGEALSKSIISKKFLEQYGDANALDALRRVPGILVINNAVQLVGLDARYTQLLLDGQPLRGVSLSQIPVAEIERIEIYRQGNAEFSSQSIGGTINIISRKISKNSFEQFKLGGSYANKDTENFELLRSEKNSVFSYSIGISGGENGAQSSIPSSAYTVVTTATGAPVQDYGQTVTRSAENLYLRLAPRLQLKYSPTLDINLSSSLSASQRTALQKEIYEFDYGPSLPVGDLRQDSHSKIYLGNMLLKVTSQFQKSRLEFGLGFDGTSLNSRIKENTFDSDLAPVYLRYQKVHAEDKGANTNGKLSFLNIKDHEVSIGWEGSIKNSKRNRAQNQKNEVGSESTFSQRTESRIVKADVFAQDEWTITKAHSAYLGLRYESIATRAVESGYPSNSVEMSVISPVAQLLWKATENDRFRFGLGHTYLAPTDEQLLSPRWTNLNNTVQTPNLRGNPLLRPEYSWSFDARYEHEEKSGLTFSLSTKIRKIHDVIRETLTLDNGEWWLSYANMGRAVSKSVELEAQFPLKAFYESEIDINFSFAFSQTWSSVKFLTGPYNSFTPGGSNINASIDYQSKTYPLGMGFSLRNNESELQKINANKIEKLNIPFDVSAYSVWTFDKKSKVKIGLDNIFKHGLSIQDQFLYSNERTDFSLVNSAYRRFSINFETKF